MFAGCLAPDVGELGKIRAGSVLFVERLDKDYLGVYIEPCSRAQSPVFSTLNQGGDLSIDFDTTFQVILPNDLCSLKFSP